PHYNGIDSGDTYCNDTNVQTKIAHMCASEQRLMCRSGCVGLLVCTGAYVSVSACARDRFDVGAPPP
ncbi:MAG: hypothetical protein ACK56I_13825, partial [bacterium]